MKKKIIIGCILAAFLMMMLPSTSVAESNQAEERIELEQVVLEQSRENVIIKNSPWEPACILRLLLWLRNLLALGLIGVLLYILRNLFNSSAPTTQA